MPIEIRPREGESRGDWMSRCTSNSEVQAAAETDEQARAICLRLLDGESVDKATDPQSRLGQTLRSIIDNHVAGREFLGPLMAQAAGVSRSRVRDYLSVQARTCATRQQLVNIAAVLDASPDRLIRAAKADGCDVSRFQLSRSQEGTMLDSIKFWGDDDVEKLDELGQESLHTRLAALNEQYVNLHKTADEAEEQAREVVERLHEQGASVPADYEVVEKKIQRPSFEGTSTASWSKPSLSDWISAIGADESQWSELTRDQKSRIASGHLEVINLSADEFSDAVGFPVVEPESRNLNRNALQNAKSRARFASDPDRLESVANSLLEDNFDVETSTEKTGEETLTHEEIVEKHNRVVDITGPEGAPVLFVGAAPDVTDAVRKKALTGPEGRVFEDVYLSELEMDRSDVQVGNLVPVVCRDEDGHPREPTEEELDKYEDWFWDRVETYDPDHIVALGTTARDALGEYADGWLAHPSAVRSFGDDGRIGRKAASLKEELSEEQGSWKQIREQEEAEVNLIKADDEKQVAYFVVYEPFEKDAHGEWARPEAIEQAAHDYIRDYGVVGKHHARPIEGEVVENWTAKTAFTWGGEEVKKGSWLTGIHVADDEEWARLRAGEYGGISMGGRGRRR